jgi:5'(3')-deoxyribonucleotidase
MFIENFNKIIISELKYVLSEMPEAERTPENLIEKFSAYIGGSHEKKKKVPTKKEPLEESVRCCALKKDGVQCNGKRLLKENVLTDLCSLHTRNGVKFGYYAATDSTEETSEEPKEVQETSEELEESPEEVEDVEVPEEPKKTVKKRTTRMSKIKESLKKEESAKVIYDYKDEPEYKNEEQVDCDSDFE